MRRAVLLGAICALAMAGVPAAASAGQWAQVSCVNPDGSAATNQGWAGSSSGAQSGSNAITSCGPGSPMTAYLSADAADPVGATETLTYTPPAGSTLAGGSLSVSGSASSGSSTGSNASGTAVVYTPQMVYNGSNVTYQCASGLGCEDGTASDTFSDVGVTLPANAGGDLYLAASCGGAAGYNCDANATNGMWSQISLNQADLLLATSSVPSGSGFSGTLLSSPTQGATASLLFTAADANGPGVYSVGAAIDGTSVYSGTPNPNGGQCAAVGTYSGTTALEFDSSQPCLQQESVNLPVNTASLTPGSHELTVTVTDAAGDSTTVDDQYITIAAAPAPATTGTTTTPSVTPTPVKGVKKPLAKVNVRFVLDTHVSGATTRLLSAVALKLPRNATLKVSDSGPRHPKLKVTKEPAKRAATLLRALTKLTFHSGDRLVLDVIVPHKRQERLQLTFRTRKQITSQPLAP